MSKKEKLIKKLKSRPSDFTFEEAEILLQFFLILNQTKGVPVVHVSYSQVKIMHLSYFTNHIQEKNYWHIK